MTKQRRHIRKSKYGKRFYAGKGNWSKVKKKVVAYRKVGYSDAVIDKLMKQGKVYLVRKDVGRPKHHYMDFYYYGKRGSGKLIKTTMHPYK